MSAVKTISTILKHDRKINTYKIALLRAINDIVLSYPDLRGFQKDIAIPLDTLAQFWVGYYWPFCDPEGPILQGPRARRGEVLRSDMVFRRALTEFRRQWEHHLPAGGSPQDGFLAIDELRRPRRRAQYVGALELLRAYDLALQHIKKALHQPIRYAGPGEWTVFEQPKPYRNVQGRCIALPGTKPGDVYLVIPQELWAGFQEISLYIEALCLHEWCLFTETKNAGTKYGRGYVYALLTSRPDNRRPLTWERNRVDILLMEGKEFSCPWTGNRIRKSADYELDHIIPIALYPINELWNLVPSNPRFNKQKKRDRLPSQEKLQIARPRLSETYGLYESQLELAAALEEDVSYRFTSVQGDIRGFPESLSIAVMDFVTQFGESRNVAQF